MADIICQHCGAVNCFTTEVSGPHLKASCSKCHRYIKFLPQGVTPESIMPFGKYKDKALKDIPPDYLIWMYDNDRLKGSIKKYVQENVKANGNNTQV